ncbi:MAG: cysteine hydrolase [Tabrizicola sp.]|nr:cysteine hydrolase [Tabrizicola sp.]
MQVAARPYDFALDPAQVALVVIDMQRDFIEPGGFGDTLGNDVSRLKAIVPTVAALIALFRKHALPVIHTREAHKPDLSDCPPAKRLRGAPGLRIGDEGAMGRILIAGEPGNAILPELAPLPGEIAIDKPGKGTTEVCVQTSMREANDRGYDCLLIEDATESYFPAFKAATIEMIVAQGGIVGWATPLAALAKVMEASHG